MTARDNVVCASLILTVGKILLLYGKLINYVGRLDSNQDSEISSIRIVSAVFSDAICYAHRSEIHSACSESVGGPSGAARGRRPQFRRPEVSPSPPPQNVGQRHVSPSAAHRSAFRPVFRILLTTSGESILLSVVARHPKLNLGRRPIARYRDSDIPSSSSRTYPVYRTFRVQNSG